MRVKRWPMLIFLLTIVVTLTGCPDDDPMISVDDQTFEEGDDLRAITVADATIDNDGFAVVYDDDDGQPGDVIGASQLLEDGDHQDFQVTLDRDVQDGEIMWAILHYDALDAGEFERPDKQPPVTDDDGNRVKDDFQITVDIDVPPEELSLEIDDQTLPEDDLRTITVTEAMIDDDGFVVIFEDDDGDIGDEVVGASELLTEGMHTGFTIELDRDIDDEEILWGRLHYDELDEGEFIDADEQRPALDDDGQEVTDSFEVTIQPPDDEPFIDVSDQTLSWEEGDLSTIVMVDEVNVVEDGWVAIHDGACEDLGVVLGQTALEADHYTDVRVDLNRPAAPEGGSNTLCAVLHVEETGDDFDPEVDLPARDEDDEIVMESFTVDVVEGTAAIRVTLEDDTPPVYVVDLVEPGMFSPDFMTDNDVVEMELRRGWRYEFENLVSDDDPFEFADDQGNALLSQDTEAPLENVGSINWVEDDDLFRFTVSDDFFQQVETYQSGARANMSGPVTYLDD